MVKISPLDFLFRWGSLFPLLELPILTTPSAEPENAASSFPLSVMAPEKEEHLSLCVETRELSRFTVPAHRKQIKFTKMTHIKHLETQLRKDISRTKRQILTNYQLKYFIYEFNKSFVSEDQLSSILFLPLQFSKYCNIKLFNEF